MQHTDGLAGMQLSNCFSSSVWANDDEKVNISFKMFQGHFFGWKRRIDQVSVLAFSQCSGRTEVLPCCYLLYFSCAEREFSVEDGKYLFRKVSR